MSGKIPSTHIPEWQDSLDVHGPRLGSQTHDSDLQVSPAPHGLPVPQSERKAYKN